MAVDRSLKLNIILNTKVSYPYISLFSDILPNLTKNSRKFFTFLYASWNLNNICPGPAFLLNVIERLENPTNAAFFVSCFMGNLDNLDFDYINKTFVEKSFDLQKTR